MLHAFSHTERISHGLQTRKDEERSAFETQILGRASPSSPVIPHFELCQPQPMTVVDVLRITVCSLKRFLQKARGKSALELYYRLTRKLEESAFSRSLPYFRPSRATSCRERRSSLPNYFSSHSSKAMAHTSSWNMTHQGLRYCLTVSSSN